MIALTIGTVGFFAACTIIWLIRRDTLHIKHGLSWIVIAIAFSFLGIAPTAVDYIALHLGINYPPTLALTIGVILLTLKILIMDIQHSKFEMRQQRLIQKLAMFEAEYTPKKVPPYYAREQDAE